MDRQRLSFLGTIAFLCLTARSVFSYQTVFNPFTGKLDYVGISTGGVAGQVILNQSAPQAAAVFNVSSGTVSGQFTSGPHIINEDGSFNALFGYAKNSCDPALWSLNQTTLTLGDATGVCGTGSQIFLQDDPNNSTYMIPSATTISGGTDSLLLQPTNVTGKTAFAQFYKVQSSSNAIMGPTTFYANGVILGASMNVNELSGTLPIASGGTNNSSAYTSGSVVYSNGASLTQNNAALFWDNASATLNVGASTSYGSRPLSVTGQDAGITIKNSGSTQRWSFGVGRAVSNDDKFYLFDDLKSRSPILMTPSNDFVGIDIDFQSASAVPAFPLDVNGTMNAKYGVIAATSSFGSSGQFQTGTAGTISLYNNIITVSNGVASELATIDSTGLTANVGATTLYAVPASGAGMYRVNAYTVETTAASVSSTLPNAQIIYTDKDSNTSVTIDATPVLGVAGIGQTGALTSNTVGTASAGVIVIFVKASTTVQYQTVNYASTAAGMAYALHVKFEAL